LMWVKCQSLASPSTEEYWHIGATMMRLGSVRPRSLIGVNRALMGWDPDRREAYPPSLATRRPLLNLARINPAGRIFACVILLPDAAAAPPVLQSTSVNCS